MAQTWRLITQSAGQSYNFLTGTLYPLMGSWNISPPDNQGQVTETMELGARGASDANIMAAAQTIGELANQAKRWKKNKFQTDSVWYESYGASESSKRAFVHEINLDPIVRSKYTPHLAQSGAFFRLTIIRSMHWELTAQAQNFSTVSGSAVSVLGGSASIGTIKGAEEARISRFYVQGNTLSGGGSLFRVWAGIRPTYAGISNFNPLWELENGTLGTDASLATDASNASPAAGSNNYVSCDFGTSTSLVERVGMTVDQATASTDFDHFIGRYLVLLRMKLSAAGTVGIQLRSGYASGSNFKAAKEVFLTNTDWMMKPIGEVTLPPYSYRAAVAASNTLKQFELQVHAEQVSGTPSLYMDCLFLMPTEHMVHASGVAINDQYDTINFYTHEDDTQEAVFFSGSTADPDVGAVGEFHDWQIPLESGKVYVVAERETIHNIADLVHMVMFHYSRHGIFREA